MHGLIKLVCDVCGDITYAEGISIKEYNSMKPYGRLCDYHSICGGLYRAYYTSRKEKFNYKTYRPANTGEKFKNRKFKKGILDE